MKRGRVANNLAPSPTLTPRTVTSFHFHLQAVHQICKGVVTVVEDDSRAWSDKVKRGSYDLLVSELLVRGSELA